MDFFVSELSVALPEVFLAGSICLILVIDLFLPRSLREVTLLLTMLCLLGTVLLLADQPAEIREIVLGGHFVQDPAARLLKIFAIAVVGTVLLYSRGYLQDRDLYRGEYYVLGLFGLLGIQVMISAYSLLIMYLGLEILSLSLYALVAFNRESPIAAEAAMKYFVLGAIASGTLLYGMSLIYGSTGALDLQTLIAALSVPGQAIQTPLVIGIIFLVVGVAFKFGAVPFHMWLPDVYQGAPTCVTLFIGTAPKLASFALAYRLLAEAMGPAAVTWQTSLMVLAILSLAIGNIVAIAQTNIKRMLAYSTISHVGFILLGFAAGNAEGVQAALFYTLIYVISAAAAFGMIILLSNKGFEAEAIDDFRGLNQRSPWFAGMMLLVMVSMIGIPPLAGFYAKWWILEALLNAGETWVAAVAVIFSVIGAYYYLRVIRLMYFESADKSEPPGHGLDLRVVLSANALAVLLLGLFPGALLALCARVLG